MVQQTPDTMGTEIEGVSVQAIASLGLDTIPLEYIRLAEEQPCLTTFRGPAPVFPVVDASNEAAGERSAVEAAKNWGIFQLVNHGIPGEVVAELQRVGSAFFHLPQEQKDRFAMKEGALEGYSTKFEKELQGKKSWVDFLFQNVWPPAIINHQAWPDNPPEYRKANEEYTVQVVMVVERLLEWLSKGLGLEKHSLKAALGGDAMEYLMKINFYPMCPNPDLALGVPPHTDMSAITILVPNEVPGLQVFRDGHWLEVTHIPNALIVHIGDQIEILSNGEYKSVMHRSTVNKERARMSWPIFVSPPLERIIGPLPELLSQHNPPKFKSKKFKDYQHCKINKLPQ